MNRWLEAHPWLGAMGVVGAIIGVAILITLAIGTGGALGESAFTACAIAPDFVDDALVAPRDAAYADCRAVPGRDGVWEVSGRVDAPNRLGARIRLRYQLRLRYAGEDRWRQIGPVELTPP